jgi:hypothetical protein
LAPEQIAEALAAVKAIRFEVFRAQALESLAPHLAPQQMTEALAAAKAFRVEVLRARALGSLAPHLAQEQVAEALAAAKAIGDEWYRAEALGLLAPYVLPIQYAILLNSLAQAAAKLPRKHALERYLHPCTFRRRSEALRDSKISAAPSATLRAGILR